MNCSIFLSKSEQSELFSKMGLNGLYLSPNPTCEERPVKILSVSEKTAEEIYAVYGTAGDSYNEELGVLEIQVGTALNLLEEALELQHNLLPEYVEVGDVRIKTLTFVDDAVIQLVIPRKAFAKGIRTVFAARCKNRLTGHDEILFTTELSSFLAHNRGKEKAMAKNDHNASRGLEMAFDINDIVVVQRHETVVTVKGVWKPLSNKEGAKQES